MKSLFRRGDLILIGILLILGATGWLAIHLLRKRNPPVSVEINTSEQKFEIPLRDTLLVIPGPLGETKVQIKDKKVWVQSVTCPQKLCMRQGKISRPSESIVCIPNRIVITLEGKTQLDAITY